MPKTITVDPNNSNDATACDPNPLSVKQADSSDVQIQFVIKGTAQSQWRWSGKLPGESAPIVFKTANSTFSGGAFPGGNGDGAVQVTDRNAPGDLGTYQYTAVLVKTDGTGTVRTIDPEIQNEL